MNSTKSLRHYNDIATSQSAPRAQSILPEVSAPCQQVTKIFPYQSYYDDTLLQTAVLSQPPNQPIIQSTLATQAIPGYAIGLSPDSDTPVAIRFNLGAQTSSSQTIILAPGQVVRPFGIPVGADRGAFSGFDWGLPFGWLGGGVATLLVFSTPDSDVAWPGQPEIVFQRQRMIVSDQASLPAAAPFNWPLRFPWQHMFNSTIQQYGQPQFSITPSRVMMRLRLNTLAAPATMRMLFQGSNEFDIGATGTGTPSTTPVSYFPITWGSFAASGGAGDLATQYPVEQLEDSFIRLGCDNGGVSLVSSDAALIGQYVDVVRYGRL